MEFEYRVRWYQRKFHQAFLDENMRRACAIWHRRAGKDDICLHGARERSKKRVGTYWHCLPEYAQARKALWNAVDHRTGKRRMDIVFPEEAGFKQNHTEMLVTMPWGSTWQLIGSDSYDKTVGAGPVCITYSEFALANPAAYAYHKPMLQETDGLAAFITTPRGNNHAKAMFDDCTGPTDFRERLSAIDTGALTQEQLAQELKEYQALWGKDAGRAYFEQEYMVSWNAALLGAYFGAEMSDAEVEGRICRVDVDCRYPVHTVWDLGKAANNPIWCFQVIPGAKYPLRIVDFYRPESQDIGDWAKELLVERGYDGYAYVPHDIMTQEWGQERTRFETLLAAGFKGRRIPRVSVEDGRQAGRWAIDNALFDAEFCELGIDGLKAYRREWDPDLKVFKETPIKNWAEHIGSAWRYLGLAATIAKEEVAPPKEPEHQKFVVDDKGKLVSNMSISAAIDDMIRRKRRKALGLDG